MGISLDIFSLYYLGYQEGNCQHYLLLKVEQPEFNNADEGHYAHAIDAADSQRNALIEVYKTEILAHECPKTHSVTLVGELQNYPVGEALSDGVGGYHLDIWVAETRFGHPWVVLGTAGNEAEFWREVEQEDDLARLNPIRPARKQRVYFLTAQSTAAEKGTGETAEPNDE